MTGFYQVDLKRQVNISEAYLRAVNLIKGKHIAVVEAQLLS